MMGQPQLRTGRPRLGLVLAVLVLTIVAGGCRAPAADGPAHAPGPSSSPAAPPGALLPVPTPASVGPRSAVDGAQLIAAAPACRAHRCRLLARANDFGPPGAVAALLAWDRTGAAGRNYELVVTSTDGGILWRSPEERLGHANGYERFTPDGADRLFVTLSAEPRGQLLVVLEWRDRGVHDRGSLTSRRFYGDSVAYAEDRDNDGTAEIITQSTEGVADADAGGLVESVYALVGEDYRLIGCRRLEGESFQWTTRPPRGGRCAAN